MFVHQSAGVYTDSLAVMRIALVIAAAGLFAALAAADEPPADTQTPAHAVETPASSTASAPDLPKPRRTPPRWIGKLADDLANCVGRSAARHDAGRAVVSLHVGLDGRVSEVKIEQSSGSEALDQTFQACLRTVSRFVPGREGDQPADMWFRMRVSSHET